MLLWIRRLDKALKRPIEILLRCVIFFVFSCYYIVLVLTTRIELVGEGWEALRQKRYHAVVTWHGRLLFLGVVIRRKIGGSIAAFNSPHRDGKFVAGLHRWLWIDTVYGAPNKDPQGGLKRLVKRAGRGGHILLVPDGPRGPAQIAKRGVVLFAKMSTVPMLPVGFSARCKVQLKSWDQMMLPCPFSRIVAICGAPIAVPFDADKQTQERLRQKMENEINRLTDEADQICGQGSDDAAQRHS